MKYVRKNWTQRLLIAAMAAGIGLMAATVAPAHAASEFAEKKLRDEYNNRLESVRALSSALRQQAANTGVSMATVMAKVDSRIQDAQSLAAAGEIETGRSILDEGYRLLQEAIISLKSHPSLAPLQPPSAPDQTASQDSKRREIERELASTKALLAALRRQENEKGSHKTTDISRVDSLIKEGERHLAAGNLEYAERAIHDGYSVTKAGIVGLQSAASTNTADVQASAATNTQDALRDKTARNISSSKALLEALRQQLVNKGMRKDDDLLRIEVHIRETERLLAAGKLEQANRSSDESYAMVKGAVVALQAPGANKPVSAAEDASHIMEQKGREREQAQLKMHDYEQRLKIVQALKDVLRRRAAEAGVSRSEVTGRADVLLADAARLVTTDIERALAQLAEAQSLVKTAVEALGLKK